MSCPAAINGGCFCTGACRKPIVRGPLRVPANQRIADQRPDAVVISTNEAPKIPPNWIKPIASQPLPSPAIDQLEELRLKVRLAELELELAKLKSEGVIVDAVLRVERV
jgi:hypothetical protein